MVPAVDDPVSADVLQALSHPLRLAALVALEARPQTLAELAATLEVSPAALIHHLGALHDLRLVADDGRQGRLRAAGTGWADIAAHLGRLQEDARDGPTHP
jgi:DNA-binding transcriptional ArsR family regulator